MTETIVVEGIDLHEVAAIYNFTLCFIPHVLICCIQISAKQNCLREVTVLYVSEADLHTFFRSLKV